jgi:hypothetical protein
MKYAAVVALLALCRALSAQTQAPVLTVTLADQGAAPMNLVVGTKVATATLLDLTVCNETGADVVADTSRIYQRVDAGGSVVLYDSKLVALVLTVFQDKNVYAKLFRGGVSASAVVGILLVAFKASPVLASAMLAAPLIYQAVLPVIHSPVDLTALSASVLQQNVSVNLAAHACYAGLAVAKTTGSVATQVITVQ